MTGKMKKLLLILMFVPIVSFGQGAYENPYPQPIKVQVQTKSNPVPTNSYNKAVQAGAAAVSARAASASAASEAMKNNSETIEIDVLKNTPNKYKYVVIKKVSGWRVFGNYNTIKTEIKNANKYILGNYSGELRNKRKINKSKLYEPPIPPNFINNPETLFLEWTREFLTANDRLSRLVLKNSNNETVYQAEYKNKGYTEMLRPVLSDYKMTKKDAKKQLLELKEYLDIGIITQQEFDKKAESLKKILLGN